MKKETGKYSVPSGQKESDILPNLLHLTDKRDIDVAEFTGFFATQEFFIENLNSETVFDLNYLFAIHKKALGHLYSFAGKLRTVNMSKGGFVFPAARFLPEQMGQFEESVLLPINKGIMNERAFITSLAISHAELLYLHPFREGNGRTARLLATLIILKHFRKQVDLSSALKKDMALYIKAVQQAAVKEYSLMEGLFRNLLL